MSALKASKIAPKRTHEHAIPAILAPDAPGGTVTELKHVVTDAANPSPQEPPPQSDAPAKRIWWKSRVGAAGAGAVLAVVAVGGYFGISAVLAHPSSPATAPPTSDVGDPVPRLPPGAAMCDRIQTDLQVPFNAGARGTPATSCPFVEQVRKEYSEKWTPTSWPTELTAISPTTSKWYSLTCFRSGAHVTCTGGAAAVIYLYNTTGSG